MLNMIPETSALNYVCVCVTLVTCVNIIRDWRTDTRGKFYFFKIIFTRKKYLP